LLTAKALVPLLGYLRGLGVAPQPESTGPRSVAAVLLEGYCCWLLTERGVGVKVARGYVDAVRPFVVAHAVSGDAGVRELGAGDVTGFMLAQSRRLAPKTVQRLASALRSLLRFWQVRGLIGGPLDQAVPQVANRRPGLPRPLEPGQVGALLASCERDTAVGRRDLANLDPVGEDGPAGGRGRRAGFG
jgi:integrase/recombinase XerD